MVKTAKLEDLGTIVVDGYEIPECGVPFRFIDLKTLQEVQDALGIRFTASNKDPDSEEYVIWTRSLDFLKLVSELVGTEVNNKRGKKRNKKRKRKRNRKGKKCKPCHGTGSLSYGNVCGKCKGTGRKPRKEQKIKCIACKGSGKNSRGISCWPCKGSGEVQSIKKAVNDCPACKGSGISSSGLLCFPCHGSGKVQSIKKKAENDCLACKGTGKNIGGLSCFYCNGSGKIKSKECKKKRTITTGNLSAFDPLPAIRSTTFKHPCLVRQFSWGRHDLFYNHNHSLRNGFDCYRFGP